MIDEDVEQELAIVESRVYQQRCQDFSDQCIDGDFISTVDE